MPLSGPPGIPKRAKAGVPQSAQNEVQLLIASGTVSGGTMNLSWVDSAAVTHTASGLAWNISATALTTALAAAGIPVTATTSAKTFATGAIWPITFTSPGPQNLITVASSLTGGGTAVVARALSGNAGDFAGAAVGDPAMDTTTGDRYRNSGTGTAPVWTRDVTISRPPMRTGNVYGFFGDSITARSEIFADTMAGGWPGFAVAASRGRIAYGGNFGIAGDTPAMMLDRIGQVIAAPISKCVVLAGTNSVNTLTPAQIFAQLKQIYTILLQNGIEPIVCTLTPRGDATSWMNQVGVLNFLIQDYACENDLMCVDFLGATVDPATGGWLNGTGTAANQMSSDGLHPTQFLGRRTMGQALADIVTGAAPRNRPWIVTNIQDYAVSGASILQDGLFLTNTGGLGTNWFWVNGTNTAACTAPSGAENTAAGGGGILGNWQVITYAATGFNASVERAVRASSFAVGDVLQISGWVNTAFESQSGDGGVGMFASGATYRSNGYALGTGWQMDITVGRFCARMVVPPSSTNVLANIIARVGTSAIKVAQIGIVNRTAQGLTN